MAELKNLDLGATNDRSILSAPGKDEPKRHCWIEDARCEEIRLGLKADCLRHKPALSFISSSTEASSVSAFAVNRDAGELSI